MGPQCCDCIVEHVVFGYGVHFCLGARLARLETPLPRWRRLTFLRGVEWLDVRVLQAQTRPHVDPPGPRR